MVWAGIKREPSRPAWTSLILGAIFGALLVAGCLGTLRGRALVQHTRIMWIAKSGPQAATSGSEPAAAAGCPTSHSVSAASAALADTAAAAAAAGAAAAGRAAAGVKPAGSSGAVGSIAAPDAAAAMAQLAASLLHNPLPLPWEPLLAEEDVRRAEAYYGSGRALRRVAAKLLAGKPIKVYMLGGSVTAGIGRGTGKAYTGHFFDIINATFPHSRHVFSAKGIGGTGSGIYSACVTRMVPGDADLIVSEFTVNEERSADFTASSRRGYEQLLRKLLRLRPPPPATAAALPGGSSAQARGPTQEEAPAGPAGTAAAAAAAAASTAAAAASTAAATAAAGSSAGTAAAGTAEAGAPAAGTAAAGGSTSSSSATSLPASPPLARLPPLPLPPAILVLHHYTWWMPTDEGLPAGSYYENNEPHLNTFSNYYDLPSVSIRNGLWPLMAAGVEGFRIDKSTAPKLKDASKRAEGMGWARPEEQHRFFYYDKVHPNQLGHQIVAEALAGPLRRALAEERATQVAAAMAGLDILGTSSRGRDGKRGSSSTSSSSSSSGGGGGGGPGSRLVWRDSLWPHGLPPPMLLNNEESATSLCAMQEDFHSVVARHSPGFEYRAERPKAQSFAEQKWGWTGHVPGEWVELEFDSRGFADAEGSNTTIWLIHLRSYEHMGTAQVKCKAGCQCRRTRLDGTWEQRVSLSQIHDFQVTQHERCVVRVTINGKDKPGKAPSDGFKVQLSGLMVSSVPLTMGGLQTNVDKAASFAAGEG